MSKVVKKGYLEVKLSRQLARFGTAYKRKFVVLINYPTRGLKAVDILEDEFSADTAETIEVNEYDRIEVQERQSKGKGKYGFQVTIREDELTFSCDSDEERQHWIQSFIVLKQLAMCETLQPAPPPIPEYFPVVLLKNKCASDIGHSGDYFISIQNCSIILNWKTTRAIAYQWPRTTVVKFFLAPERKGQLILNSIGSDKSTGEFVFTTEQESVAKEILGMWNICLLEFINTNAENSPRTDVSGKLVHRSISMKATSGRAAPVISRQSSSRGHLFQKGSVPPLVGNHPPPPNSTVPHFNHSITPPLPARPDDSGSEDDGPDYAHIDDTRAKGLTSREDTSVDDQLKALERDVVRASKAKRRDTQKRSVVNNDIAQVWDLGSYTKTEPDDYVEPVPSTKPMPLRYDVSLLHQHQHSSAHEPDPEWATMSQPLPAPVFDNRPMNDLPLAERGGVGGAKGRSSTAGEEAMPSIPPRPWRKDSVTSITSSLPSSGSLGGLSNRSSGAHDDPDSPTGRFGTQDDAMMSPPVNIKRSTILEEDSRTNTPNFSERPRTDRRSIEANGDPIAFSARKTPPPPLPPRSPVKDRTVFFPSSTTSSHRCPRCNGRKIKSAVGKTFSLNEHTTFGHDKHQSCTSMPDLNTTEGPSHQLAGLKQAPPSSESSSDCSGCGQIESCEQVSCVPMATPVPTSSLQQGVGVAGNSQPKLVPAEPRPPFPAVSSVPLQRQDMYVMVEAQSPILSQPQVLSMVRKGSVPEDRHVSRPNPVLSSEALQEEARRAPSEVFTAAMMEARRVEADLNKQLVRKTSAMELQQSSPAQSSPAQSSPPQKGKTKTMSVIPSSSSSSSTSSATPPPRAAATPTVPPRSAISLTDSSVMTLGRPNFRVPGNITDGSTVFAHHIQGRHNPPQAHMV